MGQMAMCSGKASKRVGSPTVSGSRAQSIQRTSARIMSADVFAPASFSEGLPVVNTARLAGIFKQQLPPVRGAPNRDLHPLP